MKQNEIVKWFFGLVGMLVWALVVVPHILPPVHSSATTTAAFLGVEIATIFVVVYIGEKIATELRKRYGDTNGGHDQ